MSTLARYLLFQLPGWTIAGVLLTAAALEGWLPAWAAFALGAVLVAKDLLFYPRLRRAYEPGPTHGGTELLGALAIVEAPLSPSGTVRIGAERWRARLFDASARVAEGEQVRVREIDQLTLVVEPLTLAPETAPDA
jgi:membrane protein implicated in regulation of membrane protease activity